MPARRKTLNPAGKKHKFGASWMHEHVSDHWVQEAQRLGYRSRAVFKLAELAEKDRLLQPGMAPLTIAAVEIIYLLIRVDSKFWWVYASIIFIAGIETKKYCGY